MTRGFSGARRGIGLDPGCAAVGDAEFRSAERDQDVQDSRCFGQMVMLERRMMERAKCQEQGVPGCGWRERRRYVSS